MIFLRRNKIMNKILRKYKDLLRLKMKRGERERRKKRRDKIN
jgi:hypothetical protein